MTFAVINTGGKQYKVSANDKLRLEKLSTNEGEVVEFDQVLLTNKDNEIDIGEPIVEGAKVQGKILNQTKNRTVIVFKKRRRQNSRRKKRAQTTNFCSSNHENFWKKWKIII